MRSMGHGRLAEAGAVTSVGSRGDSFDNALAETIIGLYKTELIRRRGPWKGLDEVEYATLEWVDWFNHRRLLEPIGQVPPAEFEAVYWTREDPSHTPDSKTCVSGEPGAIQPMVYTRRRSLGGRSLSSVVEMSTASTPPVPSREGQAPYGPRSVNPLSQNGIDRI
jgi:Integrase core domain